MPVGRSGRLRASIAPPGVCVVRGSSGERRRSPYPPSMGCPSSRSTFARRSGPLAWPLPLRRLDDHEVFRRPICPRPAAWTAPSGLGPSQGDHRGDVRVCRPGFPSWGSLWPVRGVCTEVRFSRGCHSPARSAPGVFLPHGGLRPLRALQSRVSRVPRHGRIHPPRRQVRTGPPGVSAEPRSIAARVSAPRTLRNTRRATRPRRTG